jgi:hypothetical protein
MRATSQTVLDVPIDRVDLDRWMFSLSDEDYREAARGHHAAGLLVLGEGRGTINVESVGGHLIIQRYRAVRVEPTRTELYSARSQVFLLHLVPVAAQVRWIMEVEASGPDRTVLTCTVETTVSPLLTVLARAAALPYFLRRHVAEETVKFAQDITRKQAAVA